MNNKKRISLREAVLLLEKASQTVSNVLDNEQDCLDEMPENLQASENYERMEAAVDNMEEAMERMDSAIEYIKCAAV